jgi:hypothetical protein
MFVAAGWMETNRTMNQKSQTKIRVRDAFVAKYIKKVPPVKWVCTINFAMKGASSPPFYLSIQFLMCEI